MGHGTGTRRLAAHLNELGTSNRILVLSQRFLGFIRGKPLQFASEKCTAKGCFNAPKKGFWREIINFSPLSYQIWITSLWDFLMFFILPKNNGSVKIISIYADNDFSPLRRYIFRRRKLFIYYVIKYENRQYKKLERLK